MGSMTRQRLNLRRGSSSGLVPARASSQPSNASCSIGVGSRHRPKHGVRSSNSSRASTIHTAAIPRSDISHRSTTSGGIMRQACRRTRRRQGQALRAAPRRGRPGPPQCAAAAPSCGSGRKNGSSRGEPKNVSKREGKHAVRSDSLIPNAQHSAFGTVLLTPNDWGHSRDVLNARDRSVVDRRHPR